jgi:hypothetical protein
MHAAGCLLVACLLLCARTGASNVEAVHATASALRACANARLRAPARCLPAAYGLRMTDALRARSLFLHLSPPATANLLDVAERKYVVALNTNAVHGHGALASQTVVLRCFS